MSLSADIYVLLIVIAGLFFFSVNSFSLRNLSFSKLQEALREVKKEKKTDIILKKTDNLALSCSLFRIALNIIGILIILDIISKIFPEIPLSYKYLLTACASLLIYLLFSLAIPQALANYRGEVIISRTYKILLLFSFLASPILWFLKPYDLLIKRLIGVTEVTPDQQQEERQEEFLTDLEQHRLEGAVDEEEQHMIENVLDLSESTADEIMTPRTDIVAIDANAELDEILKIVNKAGHSRLPVYQESIDNIIGLLYAKDLLGEIGKKKEDFNLRKMLRQAYFVPETKPLRSLLHEFQKQRLHIAVVLDEYGGTAGIVTIEDILEELVGEITDEYEQRPPDQIITIDQDTIEVDARAYVDELNDQFNFDLPEEEDYDTIGGFVFSHLGYIPKSGETFDYQNLNFNIISAETRKINRLRIKKLPPQKNA
ncbi:MAG: HlyC/CorC family transporter [Planctomycetes bacterium]|nr:HlyC/CorC family transporter [Planctomycetota bacterium]